MLIKLIVEYIRFICAASQDANKQLIDKTEKQSCKNNSIISSETENRAGNSTASKNSNASIFSGYNNSTNRDTQNVLMEFAIFCTEVYPWDFKYVNPSIHDSSISESEISTVQPTNDINIENNQIPMQNNCKRNRSLEICPNILPAAQPSFLRVPFQPRKNKPKPESTSSQPMHYNNMASNLQWKTIDPNYYNSFLSFINFFLSESTLKSPDESIKNANMKHSGYERIRYYPIFIWIVLKINKTVIIPYQNFVFSYSYYLKKYDLVNKFINMNIEELKFNLIGVSYEGTSTAKYFVCFLLPKNYGNNIQYHHSFLKNLPTYVVTSNHTSLLLKLQLFAAHISDPQMFHFLGNHIRFGHPVSDDSRSFLPHKFFVQHLNQIICLQSFICPKDNRKYYFIL